MYILKLFSKKWILFTIVVVLLMVMFVRLGFWQLDRMEQKRAYNTLLADRWRQEPFNLSQDTLPESLDELEYRRVTAEGTFDYANQLILKSQVYRDAVGVALVTPFVMADNRAVLVARGWAPVDRSQPQFWPEMEEPAGAEMIGLIRPSQALPNGQSSTPPAEPQGEWYRIDIPAIQAQMPYALEPVWIQQLPEEGRPIDRLPVREEPMTLDEGNHLGYAVQWFAFAVIAGFGYIMFVRHRERQAVLSLHKDETGTNAAGDSPSDIAQDEAPMPETLSSSTEQHAPDDPQRQLEDSVTALHR